ncbi:MAG TPA: hypothetical protein VJ022_09095 [Anaerolineales bacterium]|nr:hypothetical protein [Anaerolineales bacterium]
MKTRLFPILGLVAVLMTACAPAATQPPPAPPVAALPSATPIQPLAFTPQPILSVATEGSAVEEPLPVATSRGPDLEATDPTTVNLASGQYQFVEFFRFT